MKAYESLQKHGVNLIASGGISSMEELEKLRSIGAWGAILGKAIYTDKLDLKTVLSSFGGQ